MMENSPRAPRNPYEGLTREELYALAAGQQAEQRELNTRVSQVGAMLLKVYVEELRREPS